MPDTQDAEDNPSKEESPAETEHQPPEAEKKEKPKEEVPPEVWKKHTDRFKREAKQEMAQEIAKSLGMEYTENKERDPIESLTNEVKGLKKQVKLREWESRNPFVLSEENEEKWNEALKNPRYEGLEYEEIAKLAGITKKSKGKKDEPVSGSVPSFNRVIPKSGTKQVVEAYRKGNKDVWNFS